ncbi:hypothetical protein J6590_079078 [Homalodisca vitripennis]|nr:hypothetical protein J6590_079078 [Homalodisca vitripennis]
MNHVRSAVVHTNITDHYSTGLISLSRGILITLTLALRPTPKLTMLCSKIKCLASTGPPFCVTRTSIPVLKKIKRHHIAVLDMDRMQLKHFTRHGMYLHIRGKWQLARFIGGGSRHHRRLWNPSLCRCRTDQGLRPATQGRSLPSLVPSSIASMILDLVSEKDIARVIRDLPSKR